MSRTIALMLILFIAWLMIIAGSLMIWAIATFLMIGNALTTGIMKVVLGSLIVLTWAFTWRKIAYDYFWRTIKKRA